MRAISVSWSLPWHLADSPERRADRVRSTPVAVRTPLSAEAYLIGPVYGAATVFLNKAKLIAFFVAILVAIVLYMGLEYTRWASAGGPRPTTRRAATYMGIEVDTAYRIAFGLGAGITAIAGGLMAPISPSARSSASTTSSSCTRASCSRHGQILGAFWGGLTVGFVQQFSALILPPQLQNAAIFVVFFEIVLLRPQGLFGRSAERA